MKEQNPIDEYFREHLTDAEVKPSADLWAQMEPRLEDRKGGRKGWFIGIAASITMAFAITSWMYDTFQHDQPVDGISTDPVEEVDPMQPEETPTPIDTNREENPEQVEVQSIANEAPRRESPSNKSPRIIGHDAGQSARQQTALNNDGENRTFAMNEGEDSNENGAQNSAQNEEATGSGYNVKVKIDPYEYLAAQRAQRAQETEEPTTTEVPERVTLDVYAGRQLENIIEGKALEAPTKENVRWPQLSISLSPIIQKFSPLLDNSNTQE